MIAAAQGAGVTRYDVLGRLAVGGMAEIFLARAAGLEGFAKYVVVKRMLPEVARRKEMVAMFLDEARITARLRHQNIAQVYDFGLIDESYFFTMEYLHGRDLRAVMARTTDRNELLPLQHALTIACGAAQGLHHAHEAVDDDGVSLDIVHRDVSLSNIVVTFDGGVKMVDFGVAKARSRSTETRAGGLKGKIAYMSPEQCLGDPVDRRSDVFALGIVLYELTTSSRLFKTPGGDAEFKIMQRIVYDDIPRPSTRVEDYPAALESIVMRALSKKPAERHPTAQDLLVDIEHFAAAAGMPLSTVGLSRYIKALFGDAAEPWRRLPTETPVPGEHTITITGEPVTLEADAPFVLVTQALDTVSGSLPRWQAQAKSVPPQPPPTPPRSSGPIPIHEQETRIDDGSSISLRRPWPWLTAWRSLRAWWVLRASSWLRSRMRRRPAWMNAKLAGGAAAVIFVGVIIGFIVSGDDMKLPSARIVDPPPPPPIEQAPPAPAPAPAPASPPVVEPPPPAVIADEPTPVTPTPEPAAAVDPAKSKAPAAKRRRKKASSDLERGVTDRVSDEWKPAKRSR